ncbi:LOW QUALITY PROTEIN: hypothetical protein HZS_2108 [Henneguya salminicola]|nr:LOW QUALITY PROTEIN: hypothetical protein HZS_2108 [Henneguya salminicola]
MLLSSLNDVKYVETKYFSRHDCHRRVRFVSQNFFFKLAYYWLTVVKPMPLIVIAGFSSATMLDQFKHFRKLASHSLELDGIRVTELQSKLIRLILGEENTTDHPEKWRLALGGGEISDRTAAVLPSVILTQVRLGTMIITDCFRSYCS